MLELIQTPFNYNLSKNKQVFTFSGSSTPTEGFEFIFDILKTDNTLISRSSVPYYPNSNMGFFDVSKIVNDYILNNDLINLSIDGYPIVAPNSYLNYKIALGKKILNWTYDDYFFGPSGKTIFSSTTLNSHNFQAGDNVIINHDSEVYYPQYSGNFIVESAPDDYSIIINTPFNSGPVVGGTVNYADYSYIVIPDLITSSGYTSYIGALNEDNYIDYDPEDYIYNLGAGLKNLSSYIQDKTYLDKNSHFYLYCPNFEPSGFTSGFVITTKDKFGNELGEYKVEYTGITTPIYLPVGPKDLSLIDSSYITVVSGSNPIMTDNVYQYDFYLINSREDQLSILFTFNINRECTKFGDFQIMFQDRLGSYGSFNFNLKREDNLSTKRTFYNKNTGIFDITNGSYFDRTNDYGLKSINVLANQELTIRIELKGINEVNYFKELLLSNKLYYVNDEKLYPIIIKDGTYQIFDDTDSVYEYTLKIAKAKNINIL